MGKLGIMRGIYSSMYSLGLMDKWKTGHMKGGTYQTATQVGDYKLEYFNDDNELQLIIWNPDRPCIVILLLKDLEIAVLDVVKYDERCTVDGKMEKGSGTRKMVQFALDLMKEAGAKRVHLVDESRVDCYGKSIKLGPMYFFKNGQTWYEKYFGFQPIRHGDIYKKAKEIRETLGVENEPCSYFTDDVIYDLARKTGFDKVNDYGWEKIF